VIDRFYSKYEKTKELTRLQNLESLTKVSGAKTREAIARGQNVLASRVVETDVLPLFQGTPTAIEGATNMSKSPKMQLRVPPVNLLPRIGREDASRIRRLLESGKTKDQVCWAGRAISPVDKISELRALWLYLGSAALVWKLNSLPKLRGKLQYEFGPDEPSARDTFVLDKSDEISKSSEPISADFVLMDEAYAIGLDSWFFTVRRLGQFQHDLMKETMSGSQRFHGFEDLFGDASVIENEILSSESQLENAIRSNLHEEEFKGEAVALLDSTNGELSAVSGWKRLIDSVSLSEISDAENLVEAVSARQKYIEAVLARCRKAEFGIEQVSYLLT